MGISLPDVRCRGLDCRVFSHGYAYKLNEFMASPGFAFGQRLALYAGKFFFASFDNVWTYSFSCQYFAEIALNSSYGYLERRFGRWARIYAAIGYIMMQIARLGLVMYTISLAMHFDAWVPVLVMYSRWSG